jgi:hypothetical protein
MRGSVFENVSGTIWGQIGAKVCGQFDHDEVGLLLRGQVLHRQDIP